MTVKSGDQRLQLSANNIVQQALRKCGAIDAEEAAQDFEITQGIESLNIVIKAHQNQLHLWKRRRIIVFTDVGKERYLIGPGGDETCYEEDFIGTKISTITAAAATTIPLDSTTGMEGADDVIINGGPNFLNTAGWTIGNTGVIAIVGGDLELTNGAASAGFTDRTFTTVIGRAYVAPLSYVLGTSVSAVFSIIDAASTVLDTVTLSATGTDELTFTATSTTTTFRMANTSAVITETSLLDFVDILDTTTGDFIGIKLDDDTRQFTKILTVDSSIQVRIVDALTDGTAVGDNVYTFTEFADRPLRALNNPRYQRDLNASVTVEPEAYPMSRLEYDRQSEKSTTGSITNVYFNPAISEDTDGNRRAELFVWPTSDTVDQVVKISTLDPIDIIVDSNDLIDFPDEWTDAIIWMLADNICEEYTSDNAKINRINIRAEKAMKKVKRFDHDRKAIKLVARRR